MGTNKILATLIVAIGTGLFIPARSQPPRTMTISVEEVVSAFRAKNKLEEQARALQTKSRAAVDARESTLRQWSFESGSEIAASKSGERKFEVGIGLKQVFGFKEDALREMYRLNAQADALQSELELRERTISVAKLYNEIRLQNNLIRVTNEILSTIGPIVAKSKLAAEKGTVAFLSSRRWQLIERSLESDRAGFERNFAVQSETLEHLTGIHLIPNSPPVLKDVAFLEVSDDMLATYPLLLSLDARRLASGFEAELARSEREVSITAGSSFDFAESKPVMKLGLELPLGQGAIANSQAKAILADADVIRSQKIFAQTAVREKLALLRGEQRRAKALLTILKNHISDLSELTEISLKAFQLGRAEVSEVFEALKELYEQKTKVAEVERDLANTNLELRILFKGDAS